MRWIYKTVHFEMKKEGLLGSTFIDETEIEQELNEYGRSGWELISLMEVKDGLIGVLKQPLDEPSDYDEDFSFDQQVNIKPPTPVKNLRETEEIFDTYAVDDEVEEPLPIEPAEERVVYESAEKMKVQPVKTERKIGEIKIE